MVGGGTGGHASPIRSIYDKLRQSVEKIDILVIGSGSSEEKVFFSKIPSYKVIKAGKLHRYFTLKNLLESFDFIIGFVQSLFILLNFKPDQIFSKGGYVSLPMILSAKILKIPYMLHESDIEMGKANSFMAKGAKKVFVSYPIKYYPEIAKDKLIFSGPVLRPDFLTKENMNIFGFNNSKPVVLLTGGSQGSLNLSRNFLAVGRLLLEKCSIIHQAGKHSIKEANDFLSRLNLQEKSSYYLTEVLSIDQTDQMAAAISVADLVVTRAGSTILEIATMGKPMILIPWQYSASDHQAKNADFFLENKAAIVIKEQDLTSDILYQTIEGLINDGKKRGELSSAAAALVPKNGLELIVNTILGEVQ